ncbi:GNAT family N-acetyltransferase [Dactylosporangium sp. AC04546]|uniref:GNAT family N-acetyltransferase n=1 Tax=Dactylosporangium sp. AC04546 TaxID=2862460 RepID=UPI001EDD1407|nr:GNAT family N-acetyltransferase [Dactylosporangium sp. AC04546]WVK86293.1 GNAT family N-acetyltransferase [Dactylosporangium sp. AC04546]
MTLTYEWRGDFGDPEVAALHARSFDGDGRSDWRARLDRHALGWVCAREDGDLVGFVVVAWDGGAHAFILDTMVAPEARRRGIGARLVELAAEGARAAGCDWLHVDFEPHLRDFYLHAGGFTPTDAGLKSL